MDSAIGARGCDARRVGVTHREPAEVVELRLHCREPAIEGVPELVHERLENRHAIMECRDRRIVIGVLLVGRRHEGWRIVAPSAHVDDCH